MSIKTKRNRPCELSARYPRVIEWSPEDGVFVGSAPPLVGQCCHGLTEEAVARQLAVIVEDLAEDVLDGKMPAPRPRPPTSPTAASFSFASRPPYTARPPSSPPPAAKASTSSLPTRWPAPDGASSIHPE